MRVIGLAKVSEYLSNLTEGAAAAALLSWIAEAKAARWTSPTDLRAVFPSVRLRGSDTIFLFAQPDQVVVAQINYGCAVLLVRMIGRLPEPNIPDVPMRDALA